MQGKVLIGIGRHEETGPVDGRGVCCRTTFWLDPVPAFQKSLPPRGTGKGLPCIMEADNIRMCMCVELSRSKHQAHPKSTREEHLLYVVLIGSDRE